MGRIRRTQAGPGRSHQHPGRARRSSTRGRHRRRPGAGRHPGRGGDNRVSDRAPSGAPAGVGPSPPSTPARASARANHLSRCPGGNLGRRRRHGFACPSASGNQCPGRRTTWLGTLHGTAGPGSGAPFRKPRRRRPGHGRSGNYQSGGDRLGTIGGGPGIGVDGEGRSHLPRCDIDTARARSDRCAVARYATCRPGRGNVTESCHRSTGADAPGAWSPRLSRNVSTDSDRAAKAWGRQPQ